MHERAEKRPLRERKQRLKCWTGDGRLLLCGHRGRDALCPTASSTSKISRSEGLRSGARASRLRYLALHQPHGYPSDRIKERANELGYRLL